MRTQRLVPVIAAAVLASTTAFAQSSARTSDKAKRETSKQPAESVTLVGCLQTERDYRRTHDLGKGGAAGTGIGSGDEYVLINASRGTTAPANVDCSFQGTPEAYELTGKREHDLKPFVGKLVQISGTIKKAKVETLPSGEKSPTGGFDPTRKDLRLFEVEVSVFQTATATASAPAATTAQRPAEVLSSETRTPASEPPRQVARAQTELPKTASPLPLSGMIGLLSIAGAVGLRGWRRR